MSAEKAVIAAYVRIADSDLRSARVLAQNGLRNAWYELEQAAEKLIRATLTSEGIRGGVHHRLDQMVDLIPDENPLKPAMRSVQELAAYATTLSRARASAWTSAARTRRLQTGARCGERLKRPRRANPALFPNSRHLGPARAQRLGERSGAPLSRLFPAFLCAFVALCETLPRRSRHRSVCKFPTVDTGQFWVRNTVGTLSIPA